MKQIPAKIYMNKKTNQVYCILAKKSMSKEIMQFLEEKRSSKDKKALIQFIKEVKK